MFFFYEEKHKKKKHLPPGTTLYFVIESIADRAFSGEPYHYEIISGEIRETHTFDGSRSDEYVVPTRNRLGRGSCLEYPLCSNVGKTCFLTLEEAIAAAEEITAGYEKTWGWALKGQPLMRPWKEKEKENLRKEG